VPHPEPPHELEDARRDVALSQDELWMRYFALGGAAMPTEFEAYLVGALSPAPAERDILVHALNERSMELGLARRWPYSEDGGGGGRREGMELLSHPSAYETARDRAAAARANSMRLAARIDRAQAVAGTTRRRAWLLRLQAKALRDQGAALRQRFDEGLLSTAPTSEVRWFSLDGVVGDEAVWARWTHGHLRCHPALMTQARLLVELGTTFEHDDPPAHVDATVTGTPAAVMLTLASACDRVLAVDYSREVRL